MGRKERTSNSLLYPGMIPPAGSVYCLQCPYATHNEADPHEIARKHHEDTGHPTMATPWPDQDTHTVAA